MNEKEIQEAVNMFFDSAIKGKSWEEYKRSIKNRNGLEIGQMTKGVFDTTDLEEADKILRKSGESIFGFGRQRISIIKKERQRLKAEVEKAIDEVYNERKEKEDDALDEMPDEVAIKLQTGFLLGYADGIVKFREELKKRLGI